MNKDVSAADNVITITKEKTAEALKDKIGLSLSLCEEIIFNIFNEIITLADKEKKLMIKNFGVFKVNHKKNRPGFNIKERSNVEIKARNILSFTPAKELKNKIKNYVVG